MSKKTLLSESQVRQFMKLAKLAPLTPGFVEGLNENTTEDLEEGHGRGGQEYNKEQHRGGGLPPGNLSEDSEKKEKEATERELGHMDDDVHDKDEEIDDLEADLDDADAELDGDGADQMISVGDLMTAMKAALEDVTGQPVEATVEDEEEVEVADVDMGDEAGMEMDVEVEDEEMLQEEEGSKKGEYLRKDKDGKVGHRRGVVDGGKYGKGGHYKAKYEESVDELTEEEGSKKGEYLRKDKDGKVGKRRGDVGGGKYGKGGHYKAKYEESTEATDELVEQITKRVAARILKSALTKN